MSFVNRYQQIAQRIYGAGVNNERKGDNFSIDSLKESVLNSSPISLLDEVPIEWREDLVVQIFTSFSQSYTLVPSKAVTGYNQRPPNVQIPNKMSNVTIARSPFYCCAVCLHPLTLMKPLIYPNHTQNRRIMSDANLTFYISTNVKQLLEKHRRLIGSAKCDYKWQVLLRFIAVDAGKPLSNFDNEAIESMPRYLSIKINEQDQPLEDYLDSNCATNEGRRHAKPVNITDKLSFSDCSDSGYKQVIKTTWWQTPNVFQYYYVGVYLERKLSVSELLRLFTSDRITNALSFEETLKLVTAKTNTNLNEMDRVDGSVDVSDDLEISSLIPISTLCPIGKSRIEIPLRSTSCQHFQCFDAFFFLSMNDRRSKWKCPVCDGQAYLKDLFFDVYFDRILKDFSNFDDVKEVHIRVDGTYFPIHEPSNEISSRKRKLSNEDYPYD